jgi:hypothetical protein
MHGLPMIHGGAPGLPAASPELAFVHQNASPSPPRSPDGHIASPNGHTDYSSLAAALEPALVAACDGDLSGIEWFRSSWQAGGAATARARFALTDGRAADVIVKLPVGPAEYRWTTRMEGLDAPEGPHCEIELGPTPRVFAAGTELGGYDLAWLVVERIPGHPLLHGMDKQSVHDLLTAAVDWYVRAAALRSPADAEAPGHDWNGLLHRAREAVRGVNGAQVPDHHRWSDAVKHVQRTLPRLLQEWDARPLNTWCHGDLHPGNVMRRQHGRHAGRCVLIDLALVHAGHWVEDAVYLERLFWGKPELLHGVKPVSVVAKVLKERGLFGGEDYARLANIRRVLMGACAPAYLEKEGNPRYLQAALEHVERLLPLVS